MDNDSNKKEGFGLIEVIISIAVIAVMLTGIHGIVMSTMKNNKDAQIEQQAALYGQQIFEDFKSTQVTKTISPTGLKLSNRSEELTGDVTNGYKLDLGNRYNATIKVDTNSSNMGTALNKQISKDEINKGNEIDVNLIKSGDEVKLNNNIVMDNYDESQPLTLLVNTKTNTEDDGTKEKEIIIEKEDGKNILSETFSCSNKEEEEKAIYLIINLKEYKVMNESTQNIVIKVCNEDEKDVNIIAKEKSENLFISLKQYGSGEFRFYDEKSNLDLYDITVNITRDRKTIFSGSASQNMKVTK